jgi:hypothetical protein
MADPVFGNFVDLNRAAGYNARQQGVFALHPLATPKYARNRGLRDAEFRDTLARIYVSLADSSDTVRSAYLASLPGDAATQALAQVLLGTNAKGGTGFVDFFLTSAVEAFQEIMQVDKVMSDDYVAFFYGTQPPQFQYSGMLLNSLQDDQRGGFARAYQQMLRGTQLARRGALVRLRYDSVIVSGTMIAHQQQLNADNEMAVPFSFTILVKEYIVLTNLPFARVQAADYVKLAADAAIAALQPIGTASDTRVRTVAVPPPSPADVSTAGATVNTSGIQTVDNYNAMQQQMYVALSAQAGIPVTDNIYGTVDGEAPLPPAAP